MANAKDMEGVSRVLGVKQTFDLNYNNHMMDNIARAELRQRFIFLFRLLKADIVVTYDPWGEYEENPITTSPAPVSRPRRGWPADARTIPSTSPPDSAVFGEEKYYFARFQQRVNRVVDIGPGSSARSTSTWRTARRGQRARTDSACGPPRRAGPAAAAAGRR